MHRLNGKATDQISLSDRGLLYGQTLFETIPVCHQQPLLLERHLQRLAKGCKLLSIELDLEALQREIDEFCQAQTANKLILRITVSMGEGGRGYANPETSHAQRILSIHPFPKHPKAHWRDGIKLGVAKIKLSSQPALAGIKHGNRLEQVIARGQWHDDWQEALLLDQHQFVIEGTQSNIFVRHGDSLLTPDLSDSGVAGIMREQVLELADNIGVTSKIMSLSLADIEAADEVFLSNSVIGLWPVREFQEQTFSDFSISHQLLKLLEENGAIPTL
jgi:4-amino-4-deoxychorismate lyase